jgi:hypothetical protein
VVFFVGFQSGFSLSKALQPPVFGEGSLTQLFSELRPSALFDCL